MLLILKDHARSYKADKWCATRPKLFVQGLYTTNHDLPQTKQVVKAQSDRTTKTVDGTLIATPS